MSNKKESLEEKVKQLKELYRLEHAAWHDGQDLKDLISLLEELILYREAEEASQCSEAIEATEDYQYLNNPVASIEVTAMFSDDYRSVEVTVKEVKSGSVHDDLIFKDILFKTTVKRKLFESQSDFVERINEKKVGFSREGFAIVAARDAKVTNWAL